MKKLLLIIIIVLLSSGMAQAQTNNLQSRALWASINGANNASVGNAGDAAVRHSDKNEE